MSNLDQTVPTDQLCREIGICRRTLQRYRARGLKPRFRLTQNHYHIPTVLAWLEEQAAEDRKVRR